MLQSDENESAIAALIETYRLGFLNLDPEKLASVWDSGHDPLIYVAQEKEDPIYGWAAISDYFSALPRHLGKMFKKELRDVRIDVTGDTAIAFFNSQSGVLLKGSDEPYEPASRVTMVFSRPAGRWQVIHFHESAQSAQSAEHIARMNQGKD